MKLIWRLAHEVKQYRGLIVVAMISTLAITIINMLGPWILRNVISLLTGGLDESAFRSILNFAILLLVINALKILFRFLSNYLAHKAAWNTVTRVRLIVYEKIQSFSLGYFDNARTGDLMSRNVNDTANFEQIYAHIIPETTTNVVTFLGVTIVLLTINWKLALFTCVPIPFVIILGRWFLKKANPLFRAAQKSLGSLNAELQDNFTGIHEIQAFGQQKKATGNVLKHAKGFADNTLRGLLFGGIFQPTIEFFTSLGTVIVIAFGGWLAYKSGFSTADIVAFVLYLSLFYAPIVSLSMMLEQSQMAFASAERVIEIMDTPEEITDKPGAVPIENVEGRLSFEDVSFGYTNDTEVLSHIDFSVEPGQFVALVGPTGVGKTTLVQLIARFYEPSNGRVTLDGHDLQDLTISSLRKNIAYVMQDTFLFNTTLRENIAYAKPDATIEEIEGAARIARIHDEIMNMSEGYETVIGERGVKLSGGQKQRIAIARAVLCGAPVLVLDEATSSVDVDTERLIQNAISELVGTHTVIAIAHRLSTVKNADVILVFEDGKIIQRGPHAKLVAQDGPYRKMCQVQDAGSLMD